MKRCKTLPQNKTMFFVFLPWMFYFHSSLCNQLLKSLLFHHITISVISIILFTFGLQNGFFEYLPKHCALVEFAEGTKSLSEAEICLQLWGLLRLVLLLCALGYVNTWHCDSNDIVKYSTPKNYTWMTWNGTAQSHSVWQELLLWKDGTRSPFAHS